MEKEQLIELANPIWSFARCKGHRLIALPEEYRLLCARKDEFPAGNSSLRANHSRYSSGRSIKRRPLYLPNGIIVLAISISCSFSISATQQTQHFRFVDDFNAQFLRFRQFRTCRFSGNHQIGFLRHAARDFRAQFNQSSFSVIARHLA